MLHGSGSATPIGFDPSITAAAMSLTKPWIQCCCEGPNASCVVPGKDLLLWIVAAVPTYKASCWWAQRRGVVESG